MLLDYTIVSVPAVAVSVAVQHLSAEVAAAAVLLTAFAAGAAYFGGLNGTGSGQTLGMHLAGIAVRDDTDDEVIGVTRAVLRWFVRFSLYFFLLPGLLNDLWPLWDRKHQTFADRVVGSVVVSIRPAYVVPVPPAWYADPMQPGRLRYWDGAAWTGWTHPPQPPDIRPAEIAPAEPVEPPRGVVIAVIGFALSVVAAIAATAGLRAAGRPGGNVVLFIVSEGLLWIGMVCTAWLVSRRRGTGSFRRDFGWDVERRDFGVGALGAVVGRSATVIVTIPLYAAFHNLVRNPSVGLPLNKLTPGLFAVYAVTAVVGAPIVEELLFRGVIQTRLVYRLGAVRGIAVASVMFGAAHLIGWTGPGSLLAAAAIAAGGTVLGYLRWRTGRLGTSMVAHGLFNAFAVVLVGVGVGR